MIKSYGKLIRLSILLVWLPLAAITGGIVPTAGRWMEYRTERSEIRRLQTAQDTLGSSPVLQPDLLDSGDLLHVIFPRVEKDGIQIDLYVPYLTETRGGTALKSAEIVLRGAYIPLLQTICALEHEAPQVSLRSVEFTSVNDPYGKKRQLRVSLIVQQLTRYEP